MDFCFISASPFLLHSDSCVYISEFIHSFVELSACHLLFFTLCVGICMSENWNCHCGNGKLFSRFSAGNKFDLHTLMRCHAPYLRAAWSTCATQPALVFVFWRCPINQSRRTTQNRQVSGSCKLLGSWHSQKVFFGLASGNRLAYKAYNAHTYTWLAHLLSPSGLPLAVLLAQGDGLAQWSNMCGCLFQWRWKWEMCIIERCDCSGDGRERFLNNQFIVKPCCGVF